MCEAKTGDRKVPLRIPALLPLVLMDRVGAQLAYDAFVVAIRAFPWASSDFAQRTRTATAALFSAFPALTQDAAILDRATYLRPAARGWRTASRLSAPRAQADCTAATQTWRFVVGALLERQADALAGSRAHGEAGRAPGRERRAGGCARGVWACGEACAQGTRAAEGAGARVS